MLGCGEALGGMCIANINGLAFASGKLVPKFVFLRKVRFTDQSFVVCKSLPINDSGFLRLLKPLGEFLATCEKI